MQTEVLVQQKEKKSGEQETPKLNRLLSEAKLAMSKNKQTNKHTTVITTLR